MPGKLKVFWTENSIQELLAIKEFISLDCSNRAENWVRKLFFSSENLATFALRGRIVPEFNYENIRELLIENYRLVYQIKSASIEILTIFEGHRQLKKKDIKSKS